jgi:uncharacterized protein YndB with AHSA1/START domain
MPAEQKENEIRLTRVYDAPVKTVWEAWTDPAQVAQWWGPRGFTLTTHSKDLRPGGHWAYTMHGPDGTDYPNTTLYHEVEPLAKLVYDHGGHQDRPPLFRVTVLFAERDGKTEMELRMAFPDAEAAKQSRKFIKQAGGDSTWDRLTEYLEKNASGREIFVINRVFEVSRETMFEMWIDPAHLSRWLPPVGFSMRIIRAETHEGGSSFYVMTSDNGQITMYGRIRYEEIAPPERIVSTQQFCDEHENVTRHPMAPDWPATIRRTVLFAEEGPERTRVSVLWEAADEAGAAEIDTFRSMKPGMTQGWTGSFDKLEAYLAGEGRVKIPA